MYTGAWNRTVRILAPSLRSQSTHFQSCEELSRYLPFLDQLGSFSGSKERSKPFLRTSMTEFGGYDHVICVRLRLSQHQILRSFRQPSSCQHMLLMQLIAVLPCLMRGNLPYD